MTTGRVWLVTGCSTGFGRALTEHLLDRGEHVAVTARRPETIADLVAGREAHAMAVALDVTDAGSVDNALAAARVRFGRIDVLVNNAGHGVLGTVEDTPIASARAMMECNYFGALAMVRGVISEMRERGSGQIVNIGSVAGQIGFPALAYYSASKFAMAGMSEALAAELKPFGIRVTLAELGPFATDFTRTMTLHPPRAAYDMATLTEEAGNAGWGEGDDPRAGVAALLTAIDSAEPPIRLILGRAGLEVTVLHDRRRLAERERWHLVSSIDPAE